MSDYENDFGDRSWTARCKSTDYECTAEDGETSCTSNAPPVEDPNRLRVTVRSQQGPKVALNPTMGDFTFGDTREHAQALCEEKSMVWATNGKTSTCAKPDAAPSDAIHLP